MSLEKGLGPLIARLTQNGISVRLYREGDSFAAASLLFPSGDNISERSVIGDWDVEAEVESGYLRALMRASQRKARMVVHTYSNSEVRSEPARSISPDNVTLRLKRPINVNRIAQI